jgi:hypothetical protein
MKESTSFLFDIWFYICAGNSDHKRVSSNNGVLHGSISTHDGLTLRDGLALARMASDNSSCHTPRFLFCISMADMFRDCCSGPFHLGITSRVESSTLEMARDRYAWKSAVL